MLITELVWPCLMYSLILLPRPTVFGFPPKPRMMAATIVDFPVPFGPINMFKFGPGYISA